MSEQESKQEKAQEREQAKERRERDAELRQEERQDKRELRGIEKELERDQREAKERLEHLPHDRAHADPRQRISPPTNPANVRLGHHAAEMAHPPEERVGDEAETAHNAGLAAAEDAEGLVPPDEGHAGDSGPAGPQKYEHRAGSESTPNVPAAAPINLEEGQRRAARTTEQRESKNKGTIPAK